MKNLLFLGALAVVLSACGDAQIASRNLSKAADNFEVMRKIVFYNGITNEYISTVEGVCNIKDSASQLEVVCKTGPDSYKKHFLGLSDNVTYFALQADGVDVSTYHNRITFKPQAIIPDIDFRGSAEEILPREQR